MTARYAAGEEPALSGFDLRLEPGRRIALVGPSGAGKTTVVNLLLRFLDPEEGRVMIAGRDAREYRQEDIRALFALAGQDAHVFNSTIRANLASRPSQTRTTRSCGTRCAAHGSRTGRSRFPTASTRSSARRERSFQAVSVSA